MKKKIKEYLSDKGIYESGYDLLIDILCDQVDMYKQINKMLKEEGYTVNGNDKGTFKVRNQHFKTIDEIIGRINQLTRKLSLSPKDFQDLGLELTPEEDDGFEAFQK